MVISMQEYKTKKAEDDLYTIYTDDWWRWSKFTSKAYHWMKEQLEEQGINIKRGHVHLDYPEPDKKYGLFIDENGNLLYTYASRKGLVGIEVTNTDSIRRRERIYVEYIRLGALAYLTAHPERETRKVRDNRWL